MYGFAEVRQSKGARTVLKCGYHYRNRRNYQEKPQIDEKWNRAN